MRRGQNEEGRQDGFTLIELLVVISIIGMLSTVALTSLAGARVKAKTAVVRVQADNLVTAIQIAEQTQNDYLMNITGNFCSRCVCYGGVDLRGSSGSCYQDWVSALDKIGLATEGSVSGVSALYRDPWGSPYLLDENEGESPDDLCIPDLFASAGPDGIFANADDITFTLPTGVQCQ